MDDVFIWILQHSSSIFWLLLLLLVVPFLFGQFAYSKMISYLTSTSCVCKVMRLQNFKLWRKLFEYFAVAIMVSWFYFHLTYHPIPAHFFIVNFSSPFFPTNLFVHFFFPLLSSISLLWIFFSRKRNDHKLQIRCKEEEKKRMKNVNFLFGYVKVQNTNSQHQNDDQK